MARMLVLLGSVVLAAFMAVSCTKAEPSLTTSAQDQLLTSAFFPGESAPGAKLATDGGSIPPPGTTTTTGDGGSVPPGTTGTTTGTGTTGSATTTTSSTTGTTGTTGTTTGTGTTGTTSTTTGTTGSDGGNLPGTTTGTTGDGGNATATTTGTGTGDNGQSCCHHDDTIPVPVVLNRTCTWHSEPIFFSEATHPILTVETDPFSFWYEEETVHGCLRAVPEPTVPVYRSYSSCGNDHLLSLNPNEGVQAGYRNEGPAFSLYKERSPGCAIAVHRCEAWGRHFASTQSNCEGHTDEGVLGYACSARGAGTVPLYRITNGADHLSTTSLAEAQHASIWSYSIEGTQGYVPTIRSSARNEVVLASLDLTGRDITSTQFRHALALKVGALKDLFPTDWQSRPLHMRLCDDPEHSGSCNNRPANQVVSVTDLYFTAAHLPAQLTLDVLTWRIPDYRPAYYSDLPPTCERLISPLVLDLDGDGVRLTSPRNGVMFDLAGAGEPSATGWTAGADDAFLALDRNGNGLIDDGTELFGSATRLKSGIAAANGFEALKDLDDNGDGRITRADAAWPSLRLWIDASHDGLSEPSELFTLDQKGIESIELSYVPVSESDPYGNQTRQRAVFHRRVGGVSRTAMILDIWFVSMEAQ